MQRRSECRSWVRVGPLGHVRRESGLPLTPDVSRHRSEIPDRANRRPTEVQQCAWTRRYSITSSASASSVPIVRRQSLVLPILKLGHDCNLDSSFLQTHTEYSCGCALSIACSPSSSLPPRVPPSRRKST